MLPDFATMIRARPPKTPHGEMARGVALHHATDAVFHDHAVFRQLCAEALSELSALGLERGPARAVAHVGVEILIDGVLAEDAQATRSYVAALSHAQHLGHLIMWGAPTEHSRFRFLVRALAERGVSAEHRTPDVVALRVQRTLEHRPRLALAPGDEVLVATWARRAGSDVPQRLPPLLAELRARFGQATA
jgi:hypothetical protein